MSKKTTRLFNFDWQYDYEGEAENEYAAVSEVFAALLRGDLEIYVAVTDPDDPSGKATICTVRGWKTVIV